MAVAQVTSSCPPLFQSLYDTGVTHNSVSWVPLLLSVKLLSDLMAKIQNTTFCLKNKIQSEKTQNKFEYFVSGGPPCHTVCKTLLYTTDYK
jgi:hypothetical protein